MRGSTGPGVTSPARRLLDGLDGLVADLDGVLYRGRTPIQNAVSAVHELRERGVRIVFCTNNSATPRAAYVEKLAGMGVDVDPEDLVNSSEVAARALATRGLAGKRAVVLGGPGVREAVERARLVLVGPDEDEADVLVMGRDKSFDFALLDRVARIVRNGALFIATNDDAAYPSEEGVEPGAGALVAAVQVASGRTPEVFGKPHRPMMEAAAARFPPGSRLAIVGDQPGTDLAGGRLMGWPTILVLSGVMDAAGAARIDPPPDLVIDDLSGLLEP
ncbi:MAG: HAD-IIA family hydrolase [Actinomycetota bacterium]|nr:HAD-IIA family hydrolase [Actinomycetota bacterium]